MDYISTIATVAIDCIDFGYICRLILAMGKLLQRMEYKHRFFIYGNIRDDRRNLSEESLLDQTEKLKA